MSSEIILEIRLCILKRHAVVLENCMHLEPRFETKQAPHLTLGQGAGAIALDGKRFQRLLGEIRPSAMERFRNVIRQIKNNLHGEPSSLREEVVANLIPRTTLIGVASVVGE